MRELGVLRHIDFAISAYFLEFRTSTSEFVNSSYSRSPPAPAHLGVLLAQRLLLLQLQRRAEEPEQGLEVDHHRDVDQVQPQEQAPLPAPPAGPSTPAAVASPASRRPGAFLCTAASRQQGAATRESARSSLATPKSDFYAPIYAPRGDGEEEAAAGGLPCGRGFGSGGPRRGTPSRRGGRGR